MAKKKGKITGFRRIRGRVVPIRQPSPTAEIGKSYLGGAVFGAIAGAAASKNKVSGAMYEIAHRVSLSKPAAGDITKKFFSFRSLSPSAQKSIRAGQRALGITEKAKSKFFIKAAGTAPKFIGNFSKPFLYAGGFVATAGAYSAGKKLFKAKRGDSDAMAAAKDIGAVALGMGALTATNYGFLRGTGRSHGVSFARAVVETPTWIGKIGSWRNLKIAGFKSLF
jgi:hypothetical protein